MGAGACSVRAQGSSHRAYLRGVLVTESAVVKLKRTYGPRKTPQEPRRGPGEPGVAPERGQRCWAAGYRCPLLLLFFLPATTWEKEARKGGEWFQTPDTYRDYKMVEWEEGEGTGPAAIEPLPNQEPGSKMRDLDASSCNRTATSLAQRCQIPLKITRYFNYCLKPPQEGRRGIAPEKEILGKIRVEKNRGLRERILRRVWRTSSARVKNGNSEITPPSFESSTINCLTPLFLKLPHVVKWG